MPDEKEENSNAKKKALPEEIDAARLEKLRLETEALKIEIESRETMAASRIKLAATIGTPIVATAIGLTAAFIELRTVRDERSELQREALQLEIQQRTTTSELLSTRLALELLSHKDAKIRLDAIQRVREYPPNIAESAVSSLLVSLQSERSDEVEAALSTLVAIGTQRVTNSLFSLLNSSDIATALVSLDGLVRISSSDSFDRFLNLLENEDPRISGRALAALVHSYRQRVFEHATRVATGEDVPAANAILNVLTLLSGDQVSDALSKFISFSGDHTRYLNARNPRERALWLLLDEREAVDPETLVKIFDDEERPIGERRAAALHLLNSDVGVSASELLLSSEHESRFKPPHYGEIGSFLLEAPQHRSLGIEMLLRDLEGGEETFGGAPTSFWHLREVSDALPSDRLSNLLLSPPDTATYIAAASLLIRQEPDLVKRNLDANGIDGIPRATVLAHSVDSAHRASSLEIWIAEILKQKEEDPFRWPTTASLDPLLIPSTERPVVSLTNMLDSDHSSLRAAASRALIGTQAEDAAAAVAKNLLRENTEWRFWYAQWLKDAGRTYELATEIETLIASFDSLYDDPDNRGTVASRILLLAVDTPVQEKATAAYFEWVDRAEIFKGWHNPSYVVGNIVSVGEQLFQEETPKWERSVGGRYVNSFGVFTIARRTLGNL